MKNNKMPKRKLQPERIRTLESFFNKKDKPSIDVSSSSLDESVAINSADSAIPSTSSSSNASMP